MWSDNYNREHSFQVKQTETFSEFSCTGTCLSVVNFGKWRKYGPYTSESCGGGGFKVCNPPFRNSWFCHYLIHVLVNQIKVAALKDF